MFQVAKDRAKRFLFTVRQDRVKKRKWDKIYENGRKYDQDDRIDTNTESQIRTNIPKHRKGNKRKLKGSKRNQNKKRRRRRMIESKKAELKDLLSKANEKELPQDMFHPLDNTDYNWQEQEKDVCSLGLKFVPTIRRHNLAKKLKDLLQFGHRLRLAVFFHRLEKEQEVAENDK